jgi:hypothetical protein
MSSMASRAAAQPTKSDRRAVLQPRSTIQANTVGVIPRVDEFRKEKRIKPIVTERGHQPCLVHIFSAMEAARKAVRQHPTREEVRKLVFHEAAGRRHLRGPSPRAGSPPGADDGMEHGVLHVTGG